jgi:hypothetical protein
MGGADALRVFDQDRTVGAYRVHHLTNHRGQLPVAKSSQSESGDVIRTIDSSGLTSELIRRDEHSPLHPTPDQHRISARGDLARTSVHERLRHNSSHCRSVASAVEDPPGQVANKHRAHVFEWIGKLDCAPRDDRGAVQNLGRLFTGLRDSYCSRQRAQRRAQQAGHAVDASQQGSSSRGPLQHALGAVAHYGLEWMAGRLRMISSLNANRAGSPPV